MSWLVGWAAVLFQLGGLGFFADRVAGPVEQAVILGLAGFGALATRQQPLEIAPGLAWPFALVALGFLLAAPWPYAAGGLFLAVGLPLSTDRRLLRIAGSLSRLGLALVLGAGLAGLYAWFGPLWHEVPAATPMMGALLEQLGFEGAVIGGRWVAPGPDTVHRFTPTVEGFGVFPALLLFAGGLALQGPGRRLAPGRLALLSVAIAAYLPVRYALVYAWVDSADQLRLLVDPWPTALSFLPLAAFLALADAGSLPGADSRPLGPVRFAPASFAVATLAWCCGWIALLDPDPGKEKAGRVVIDETHSEWERTDEPMDTESYGERTTYNYSGLADYLARYYDLRVTEEGITPALLDDCDVLILKTPTSSYDPEEIASIHDYVDRGGGLLLIGDHTNIFGSSTFLNAISDEYGIEFVSDATHGYDGGLSLYEPPRAARHPALTYLPPFLFATSCSLSGSPSLVPVQTGRALQTLPADYGRRSFFSDGEDWPHRPFGLFHQTVAARAGRGRVLAFSDSTVWSNFFMHIRGKPELLLGLVDWCNRSNAVLHLRREGGLLALGLLVTALGLSRRGSWKSRMLDALLFPGLLSTTLILPAIRLWNRGHYPPVHPRENVPEVHFILDGADVFLPSLALTSEDHPSYLNFFNWTQRVGLVPVMATSVAGAASEDRSDVLVLLRNRRTLSAEEVGILAERLEAGGRVLVLEDGHGFVHVTPFLERYGVTWTSVPVADPEPAESAVTEACEPSLEVVAVEASAPSDPAPALHLEARAGERVLRELGTLLAGSARVHLEGGSPWLRSDDGVCLGTSRELPGGGRLLVLCAADAFGNEHMGNSSVVPTGLQGELFELEYEIWRWLAPDLAR